MMFFSGRSNINYKCIPLLMKTGFLLLKAVLMQKIQKFGSLLTAQNIMPAGQTEVHFALAVIFPDSFSSHFSLNPAPGAIAGQEQLANPLSHLLLSGLCQTPQMPHGRHDLDLSQLFLYGRSEYTAQIWEM